MQSIHDATDVCSQALSTGETRELEPALTADVQSDLLLPDNDFMVNPECLIKTLVASFAAADGTFLRHKALDVESNRGDYGDPTRLRTDCSTLPMLKLVLCADAWSMQLDAEFTSIRIPLNTECGYHATPHAPGVRPSQPVMDCEHKLIATPVEGDLHIAGIVEISGLNATPNYCRARILMRQDQQLSPGLSFMNGNQWMGHRPSLPDNLSAIDRSECYRNVFFTFGYGHLDMTGAPDTARLITDLISERTPFIDGRPYDLQRFRQRQPQ